MKTLTGRLLTACACLGLMLSSAAHAGGIDIRIPGVDVRLPAPPLPRVTIVEPEVYVYDTPRRYAPPPRYVERRYYDRDYRRDRYSDDAYYHRRYHRHHHHHDARRGW